MSGTIVHGEGSVISVVAVPIVFIFDEPYVVFIRRARHLLRHANQIAFPGGMVEDGETLVEAMFRELEEEIGVSRDRCTLFGELSSTVAGKSNLFVQAFLVRIDRPHFRLNKSEVQDLYLVNLSLFDKIPCNEIVLPSGSRTCRFVIDGIVIWGATARIIRDSLAKIKQLLEGFKDELSDHQGDQSR
uniref:CoA pyrophosphatase n=1 Tax=Pseudothermotoga hypogea TaxID=57487 RepID=A0A832ID24_9THEM